MKPNEELLIYKLITSFYTVIYFKIYILKTIKHSFCLTEKNIMHI